MTVKIRRKKVKLKLWIPLRAVGSIAVSCAKREAKKHGAKIVRTRRLKRDIYRAVKTYRSNVGKFTLIEVFTQDFSFSVTV